MTVPSESHDPDAEAGPHREPLVSAPVSGETSGRAYRAGDIIAQKYKLVRRLGEGGMGAVWLARNLKLDVDVAIKLIHAERVTAETAERLLQEARAAARIDHRSIVRVFDFGETELDDPFIVMEVLTGESLRALLARKGRLPATQVVRTLLPIASALVEAHANEIVHRDLKPENVMLVPEPSGGMVPKLLDFGIAQSRRNREESEDAPIGMIAGTPAYMSPEQMGGRDVVDEGADVWALAVMLYEAMTGRLPFAGPNHAALMFAIMTEEPTPIMAELAGDARLWGILECALAKQSSARPTMKAFGRALAEWAIDSGIDSDLSGASLAAHWVDDTKHPFSALPPPVTPADGSVLDVVVPRAARVPKGLGALTQAPPGPGDRAAVPSREEPAPGRSKRLVWIGIAAVVAIAVVVVTRGRVDSRQGTVPAAAANGAPASPDRPAAPVPTVADTRPAKMEATSAPATTVSASPSPEATAPAEGPGVSVVPAGSARLVPKKPVRKSSLPIAKQPNF
jgi:serine/threonine-protein kinase